MDSYLQILPIYRYADMEKFYLLSADIYRQAYLQILSADIIIGRTLVVGRLGARHEMLRQYLSHARGIPSLTCCDMNLILRGWEGQNEGFECSPLIVVILGRCCCSGFPCIVWLMKFPMHSGHFWYINFYFMAFL